MVSKRMNGHLWCDVEQAMFESLDKKDGQATGDFWPHWENVWECLRGVTIMFHCTGTVILASFIAHRLSSIPATKEAFYEFLLSQLKSFEKLFGYYITKQHVALAPFGNSFNDEYISDARYLMKNLANVDEIVSIDCFNYGFTPETVFYEKCKFVNGDCINPIFGVDSLYSPTDPRYIFTKTNRRIEWDMNMTTSANSVAFDNAIVFGHSLSSNDHNYFFPILDQLEMTHFASNKKLVIAYSIYDETKELKIKKDVRLAIYTLFKAYAEYCGRKDNATRLLDSLTTQGRVITYEVQPLSHKTQSFVERTYNYSPPTYSEDDVALRWEKYLEHGKKI